ncbi:MAG: D-tyrosyl-tRNA(Tyr) deacylase [Chloroflexi bacterium]|nr:D-tyrosyl-tRNA(Tyr) deacylase [Chloroflexota bacterium]
MRAVLQRVRSASVTIDGRTVGSIGRGLVVLLAIGRDDEPGDAIYVVEKTANMRIFPDDEGHMNRSALDVGAELLVVSQFTLYADTRKGRRPSFTAAAPPESAAARFDDAVARFRATGLRVETGRFGEMMDVALVNEGPVTIWVDSAERHRSHRG